MELRKIFFSSEEVEVAMTSYCIDSGKPLPSADRLYATFKDDIDAMVTLHFCGMGRSEPAAVNLTRAEVTDALIHLCKEIGIPLPRAGKKVLWPQGDGISLMVTLESLSTQVMELETSQSTPSRKRVATDQFG